MFLERRGAAKGADKNALVSGTDLDKQKFDVVLTMTVFLRVLEYYKG